MDELMIGMREYGASTLKLSIPKALPEHLQVNIRELSHLNTLEAKRCKGHAGALLSTVCYEADKSRKVLILEPKPTDGRKQSKLVKFYEKFGFKKVQSNPTILMARKVHG